MSRQKWDDIKEKTADYDARLDVRQLARNGDFTYGDIVPVWSHSMGGGASMIVYASFSDNRRLVALWPEYSRGYGLGGWTGERVGVAITYTPCHFGGRRPWFVCSGCEGRAAILYFASHTWQCRKCLCLAYPSQCESPRRRRWRRMTKIEKKLTYIPDKKRSPGDRPKGMHGHTFLRLLCKWGKDNDTIMRERIEWGRRAMARLGYPL